MCLVTNQKPLITNQDITVYKILIPYGKQHYISTLMGFVYQVNKLYKTKIVATTDDSGFDNIAANFISFYKKLNLKPLKSYGEGFHSAICKERLYSELSVDDRIVECIIPKGSKIIFDNTGLLISNAIIITEDGKD